MGRPGPDTTLAEAWEEGRRAGHSRAMRRMSDEPNVPDQPNPYAPIADQWSRIVDEVRYLDKHDDAKNASNALVHP